MRASEIVEPPFTIEPLRTIKDGMRRKAKSGPSKKEERNQRLSNRILGLAAELKLAGFSDCLQLSGPPVLNQNKDDGPDQDPKTNGGYIGKVKESLGAYIQRVSVGKNYAQRSPFDHAQDAIYKRLIRDFIEGAIMPESKIAALNPSAKDQIATELDQPEIVYSIIDGLQRFYCYSLAVLLVLHGETLVQDGVITPESWNYFKEPVARAIEKAGGLAKAATRKLLGRQLRYEIFWNIGLKGLLHYMVTFNTGQRKMSIKAQLEIMNNPLIEELEKKAKLPIWKDTDKKPGKVKPASYFDASILVTGTQAFLTQNAQLTGGAQAEGLLEKEAYVDSFGDIQDVVRTLELIGMLHKRLGETYDDENRFILSNGEVFFVALMAVCGFIREHINLKTLEGMFAKLDGQFSEYSEDPLKLTEYREVYDGVVASRGKTLRRLVYNTFLLFFQGGLMRLEWANTFQQNA